MLYSHFAAIRMLLLVPIAVLLAFLILSDDPFHRALIVAGLVVIELIRDTLSFTEIGKASKEAKRLARRVRKVEK